MPAVIFDMDGVLIDSEPFWQSAELEVFGSLGVPLTRAMTLETTGLRVAAVVERWFARYPWTNASPTEVAARIVERVRALVAAEGRPLPGAVELVRALQLAGVPLALCSSSARVLIDAVVAKLGLSSCFQVLQSAEDCPRGKPSPDPYLATALALGKAPSECLVIEDSLNGMRSAHAAGMAVIGLTPAPTADMLALCRFTVGSFADLPADRLLAAAASPGANA